MKHACYRCGTTLYYYTRRVFMHGEWYCFACYAKKLTETLDIRVHKDGGYHK